jgi:membrane dipeptidase
MLVDVAHAGRRTLLDVTEVSKAPVIDSHTSPYLPGEEGRGPRRQRTWQEMEAVAKTGGVVCTWPLSVSGARSERTTLAHWAAEVATMKSRLGIEHCGLGTDGGGGLPRLVEGWDSIASWPALASAMLQAGLSRDDLAAFLGGNVVRVLAAALPRSAREPSGTPRAARDEIAS